MATPKRERQKAARRAKVEQQRRYDARRRTTRRSVITVLIAGGVLSSAFLFISSGSNTPTTSSTTTSTTPGSTTTLPGTTTTLPVIAWTAVAQPSAAGTWGTAPTVTVPSGPAPTTPQKSDLIVGNGATLHQGEYFTAHYVLADFHTRSTLQSSWTSQPFSTTLDSQHLITGWVLGMDGMKVGSRRELILPPNYAYGSQSNGSIAANDTLVFVVDLLSIGHSTATTTTAPTTTTTVAG